MPWFLVAIVIAGAVGEVASLVTGTSLNPVRGFGPMLVSRAQDTMTFWFGVFVLAGAAIGFGFVLFTQPVR